MRRLQFSNVEASNESSNPRLAAWFDNKTAHDTMVKFGPRSALEPPSSR
jgi:hypothetical protein